jgi:RecD/TraA family predicted helicase
MCKYSISILNGSAGSGKSFTTQAMINLLNDNMKSFILMSPTGKAAKILSEYTGEKASTIHRGLGYSPIDGWCFNKDCKLQYDVVIVDEFSMCDIKLFKHLIDAIDFECTKLVIIGDNAQLPSVGCGNLLHDFMEGGIIPTTTLTKIFRYSDGGLMKVATDTRFCKPYLDKSMKNKATQFGANKDYTFIDLKSESIPKYAVSLYKKLIDMGNKPEDIQVLTAKNVGDCGTVVLNNMIQKAINKNYGSSRFMKVGDTVYYDDDLVMQTQNNYRASMCDEKYKPLLYEDGSPQTAFVANGETAKIKYACKDYVVMDFDGILIRYNKADMNMISLSYACTIHKSQGSSIKNVILCTPKSHMFMLNSNLLYVGLTRMKEKCFHLGYIQSVNMAVKKKANLTRHTFMQDLLTDMNQKIS